MKGKPTIAVWFSCGAASAAAARLTVDLYGPTHTIRVVNNPVVEEDEDNRRFLLDVQRWLGVEIESATNANYPLTSARDVWERRKYMSGPAGAPCTVELKKRARQAWERDNPHVGLVLGFTAEEQARADRFRLTERDDLITPLIDHGYTKKDCYALVKAAGIKPPRTYEWGYPNANCIGCVKVTSPTYWNKVRETHPDVFADRAEQSRRIGARLVEVHKVRIFLDELDPKTMGRPLKKVTTDCGIFCEEE